MLWLIQQDAYFPLNITDCFDATWRRHADVRQIMPFRSGPGLAKFHGNVGWFSIPNQLGQSRENSEGGILQEECVSRFNFHSNLRKWCGGGERQRVGRIIAQIWQGVGKLKAQFRVHNINLHTLPKWPLYSTKIFSTSMNSYTKTEWHHDRSENATGHNNIYFSNPVWSFS